MTVIIFLILSILSFYKKNSKLVFIMILAFIWLIFTFCYGIPDYDAYMNRYNNIELWSGSTEILYRILIVICNKAGLSFVGFRGITAMLIIILIGSTILKLSSYPNIVALLFFICPYPMYVVQIRSALAVAVFIFGCRYLICEDDKHKSYLGLSINDLKYIIVVLIGTCIHTQSLGWLVLLIAKKFNLRKTVIFTIVFNIFIMFVITPQNLARIFNIFGAGNRINAYLSKAYSISSYRKYGPILYIIFTAFITICACLYILNRKKRFLNISDIKLDLKINIVLLCIISLFIRYTSEVYRIQEGVTLLNYILLTNTLKKHNFSYKRISKSNLEILSIVIVYCIGYLFLSTLHYLSQEVWIPFWFNNYVLHF